MNHIIIGYDLYDSFTDVKLIIDGDYLVQKDGINKQLD